jgi:UDP-glucose 4-epimerase
MRVLVTGAAGFMGSYLTELLVQQREPVAILCRSSSNLWRIQHLLPQVTLIKGDLLSLSDSETEIARFAPDTVFHLGWFGVTNSFHHDYRQVEENLQATLNLIRVSLKAGVHTWVGLGSQAEYGPQNQKITEQTPLSPTTLYGTAKICAYLLAKQLLAQNQRRFLWLRIFSTYGPKDNPSWMIPYLIQTLIQRKKPSLTACEQKWDYLYAGDAARAIYLAAVQEQTEGVYNIGSGQAVSLCSIVEQLRDLVDPSLPLGIGDIPYRPDQVMHLEADISRLQQATGWCPQFTLAEGLQRTVAWQKAQL